MMRRCAVTWMDGCGLVVALGLGVAGAACGSTSIKGTHGASSSTHAAASATHAASSSSGGTVGSGGAGGATGSGGTGGIVSGTGGAGACDACDSSAQCETCSDATTSGDDGSMVCCGSSLEAYAQLSVCVCDNCGACGCGNIVLGMNSPDPLMQSCIISNCMSQMIMCDGS